MEQIRDGKGRAFLAAVNSDNQLTTRATSIEQRLHSAIDYFYYEATTGEITLADENETGIIYLKNLDESKILVIDRVFYDLWTSTGGSGGDGTLKYYLNPTITGGTTIVPNNTNFGTLRTANGTFYKSLTTISGTVWWTAYVTDKTSAELEEGRIAVTAGNSFGISIAAPTGNTSMNVSVNVAFYMFDKELI